ncbi:hypothetical protein [Asticcacaulis sp. AND118]|uniref:hypothetical protein n=1 Tax=Asticcacaulis sp. AND118 TaxID=2840468 RepID=UPI001CFFBE71|nr:hypothetical protein [Asticcacaulis sp. AND118]UDF02643.1 hypothetical protein LH365_09370 [Asticcacaulis sp. AND118]
MEAADTVAGLHRCKKRWVAIFSLSLFWVFVCLMCLATIVLGGFEKKPLASILAGICVPLFINLWMGFISNIHQTTLFVHPDGFAYKLGKWPVRLIRWADLERTSEKYANGISVELSLRLTRYEPYLNQLENDEIRLWLTDRRIWFWISYLFVLPAKPKDFASLWPKGLTLNKTDPRVRMALRMIWTRRHSGADLGFSSFLCQRKDATAIEESYIEFLKRQSALPPA